ncbi:MAG: hypothetical protein ACYCYI_13480 [Saccharofermentanales bacterium]
MMNFEEFLIEIKKIPVIDVHTHIDTSHYTARGLDDIILYHMVITELYSAGCPSGNRLDEAQSEEERVRRIEEAIPYLEYIENTNTYFCAKTILKDLYGWEQPITYKNWKIIDDIIKKKYSDSRWVDEILKKANIEKFSTEYSRKFDDIHKDAVFSLEWSFFARTQWKQYDTALTELEYAWMQDKPGKPLSVNFDPAMAENFKRIESLNDVDAALDHYVSKIPVNEVVSMTQHFSTDISYRSVSDDEMSMALNKRDGCGISERDVYANYIMENFLRKVEDRNIDLLLQFSLGAEPLPFETGSKLRSDTLFQLAELFGRHPKIRFQAFLASESYNHALCVIVRETPNLSLAGYWWHNFFPGPIRKIIETRIDMLPLNKQAGFFSDAYCLDWAYAKIKLVKNIYAEVLYEKIRQERFSYKDALMISKKIFYDVPKSMLKI